MITGHIIRQHLNLCDSHVVADTIDYLEAKFLFKTDDWDGLTKWAHFANDSAVYDIRLTEDCIRKEDHLNLSAGMWKVYLHGNEISEDGTVIQRITTDIAVLYVENTGVLDGEPFPTVPPSAGEQIIASAQLAEAGAKESAGRAAASESSADKSAKDAALSEKAASESRDAAEKFRDETEQIKAEVETSAENALDEIASAGRAAVSAVVNAGDDAITAVRNMKNAAVQTVESAGETQVREVAEAAAQHKSEAAASAQAAKSAADAAEQAKNQTEAAASGALTDIERAAQNAKTDINTARESAVGAVKNAESAGLTEISGAVSGAKTDIQTAAETALTDIGNAGTEEVRKVQAAGEAAVGNVAAVRDAVVRDVQDAGSEAVGAVEAAGQVQLDEIAQQTLGAVRYDIAQELTDVQRGQARDNTRSAGEIVESASGEVIAVDDAADASLRGMVVYGKSTQDGTPTPDAPVPIVSVGEDGVTDVGVYGKNLLTPEMMYKTQSGFLITTYEGRQCVRTKTDKTYKVPGIKFRANTQYTISMDCKTVFVPGNDTAVANSIVSFWYTDGTRSSKGVEAGEWIHFKYTSSAGKTVSEIGIFTTEYRLYTYIDVDTFQLEAGATETAYEPYTAQSLPISTPDGLCGIPVTSGGNYTDADGQQWVCDTVDFVRGVRVQRCRTVVANGVNTTWKKSNTSLYNDAIITDPRFNSSDGIVGICDKIQRVGTTLDYNLVRHVNIGRGVQFVDVLENYGLEELSSDAFNAYLAEHPITMIYPIATPIETPLTESELAAYRALHTNKPNTTIYADDNAGVSVDYVADTKRYIDKKFAELAAAIIN